MVDLAGRVADGMPIDWNDERRRFTDADSSVLEQLAAVQEISAVLRQATLGGGAGSAESANTDAVTLAPKGELAGKTIGKYVIDTLVGRGGMGDVYKARDPQLNRLVAVKVLSPDLVSNEVARRRFLRETRLACRVSHPYVASVYDVLEEEGRVYLVMEWIRGSRLDILLRAGALERERAVTYAVEIAEALRAVHQAGLVHRDLKPANVMVTADGHVKIMDFGVALHVLKPSDSSVSFSSDRLTGDKRLVGTVAYMSPEQIRGGRIDARSDLFALGIILWQCLSGAHPFARVTDYGTAEAILKDDPVTSDTALRVKSPLGRFALRLLEKDPERRPPDAETVIAELRQASTTEGLGFPVLTTARGWRRPRRFVAVALGAAVTALVLAKLIPGLIGVERGVPVVAVLPFVERDGQPGSVRGELIANLVIGGLFESGVVRPLDLERSLGFADASGKRPAAQTAGLIGSAHAEWWVEGDVWSEGGTLVGTTRIHRVGERATLASHPLRADGMSGFAALVGSRVLQVVAPEHETTVEPAFDRETRSGEAREAEYRARAALRVLEYSTAIAALESAVKLDPGFVAAHSVLAESLYRAGHMRRARESAELAVGLAESVRDVLPARVVLEAEAIRAFVFEQHDEEREARRKLIERYRDDPGYLIAYADSCERTGRYEEALGAVEQALAIDPGDVRGTVMHARVLGSAGRFEDAVAALDRAERALVGGASPEASARIWMQRGRVAMLRQSWAAAADSYRKAAALYEAAGLATYAAKAAIGALDADAVQGKLDGNEADYERVLTVFRTAGAQQDVVLALSDIGGRHFLGGDFDEAEPRLRAALAEGRGLDNPPLLVYPMLNLAALLSYTGGPSEGAGLAATALETAREYRLRDPEALALALLAGAKHQLGRLREALDGYRELIEMARAPQAGTERLGYALTGAAAIREDLGELAAGLAEADEAVGELRARGQQVELAYALITRAHLRSHVADWIGATDDLAEAQGLAEKNGTSDGDMGLRIRYVRATIQLRRGEWSEATLAFDSLSIDAAKDAGISPDVSALIGACRARAELGDVELAEQRCRAAEAHRHAAPQERAQARALLSRVALDARRPRDAEDHARWALEECERMGAVPLAVEAAAALARVPQLPDRTSIRQRGASLLQAYLEGVPEQRRSAVRMRRDLAPAVAALESDSR
jgi:tetratricopeptide (TPR) repeat protein